MYNFAFPAYIHLQMCKDMERNSAPFAPRKWTQYFDYFLIIFAVAFFTTTLFTNLDLLIEDSIKYEDEENTFPLCAAWVNSTNSTVPTLQPAHSI